ncbi:MAG: DUF4058 family protein [Cyanobacteria bacterium P01_A01_bin.114]
MPSPFPGMDPFIEQPNYWSSFHSRLIVALANAIEVDLSDQYYVEVEVRSYLNEGDENLLVGIPDAVIFSAKETLPDALPELDSGLGTAVLPKPQRVNIPVPDMVNERYLEIREVVSEQVITVIEVLSPKNKRAGRGRTVYEEKRLKVLTSLTHLVEIDLLRTDRPLPVIGRPAEALYSILVSRSEQRPAADLYGFGLREPIPSFLLPLKPGDQDLLVHLQAVFAAVYEQARYRSRIDYLQPLSEPTLGAEDQAWLASFWANESD